MLQASCTNASSHVHDIIRKERKKERQTPEAMEKWKNQSCLRWDSRIHVQCTYMYACTCSHVHVLAFMYYTCMQVVMYMYLNSCTYMYASSHVHVLEFMYLLVCK